MQRWLRELARETDADIKIDVIPDAVDLETFTPVQRDTYPEKVRVLTIGRLIPRKGFQFLIRALPQIIEKAAHNFEIEIVGDGPYHGELLKLAENLGVASHIRFVGSVPYPKLPQKYRDADLLIFTLTRRRNAARRFGGDGHRAPNRCQSRSRY